MSRWRHLRAIALLPGMATIAAPALILATTDERGVSVLSALLALPLLALGVTLFVQTVTLFARVGRGTLAPWDPTSKLVVEGPYRRVRNPMISGVLCVLLGEAILFRSDPMLVYAAVFYFANSLWMPLVEEPALRERFGSDYERYAENVPRWRPRLRPWRY